MLWRTAPSVNVRLHEISALLKSYSRVLGFGPSESVPHFIINEAVLPRLEVSVQAVLHIDYFLVLRRTLAVVLAAARPGFLRVRVLKYLSDVHLLSPRKRDTTH